MKKRYYVAFDIKKLKKQLCFTTFVFIKKIISKLTAK